MANGHQDKAEQLALFRYQVISEAASPRLTPAERGRLARELAARDLGGHRWGRAPGKPHEH